MRRYVAAYPHIKFRIHFSSGSLVIAIKPKGKENLRMTATYFDDLLPQTTSGVNIKRR
jgi:hypothetical protein